MVSTTPTRGAVERSQAGWSERPTVARLIRLVLFLLPLIVGWLVVRYAKTWFWQPAGSIGVAIWVVQAIIVAGLASFAATRVARRFLPLSALFGLTLVFPDHAPSRLGVALRSGTIKKMAAEQALPDGSLQEAAEHAVALVAELGRHERLTRGHTERVRARAELIGAEMGLSEEDLQLLRWGVLLHDVGKLEVPAAILNKEGKLTYEEWEILKAHPENGARMVAPLAEWLGEWSKVAVEHHEKWDGSGYPLGLSGTDISLAGRITAVADAYDVITTKRSYKEAMSTEAAREELVRSSGSHFDPVVVRAALRVGLRESKRVGLVGWLFELPSALRFVTAAPLATAVSTAAVSTAVIVGASVGGVEAIPAPPQAIALAEEETSTSTTNVPATTTAVPATTVVPTTVVPTTTSTTVPPTTTTTVVPTTTTTTVPPTTTTVAPVVVAPTTSSTVAPTTSSTVAPTTTTTTIAPTTTTTTDAPTTTTTTPVPRIFPAGTNFMVLDPVPNDLSASVSPAIESDIMAYVIEESQYVTLTQDLEVSLPPQGVEFRGLNRPPTATLPAGTLLCSWLVRFDPQLNTGASKSIELTIDFGETIIGLGLTNEQLADDSEVGIPGTIYGTNPQFHNGDRHTVNGSSITLRMAVVGTNQDQIRVITACS